MRIAVIGAPGSGKTKFAKALAAELEDKHEIVDGYVPKLARRTNLAFGHFAGYPQNFQVAMERLSTEYSVNKKNENFITCGTILDTTMYCAMHGDVAVKDTVRAHQGEFARAQATMHAMGMLMADTWVYDHAFFLPLSKKVSEKADAFDQYFDAAMPQLIELQAIPVWTLGTETKTQVKQAVDTIKSAKEQSESTEVKQPGV